MSCVKLAIRVRPFTDRELKSEKDRVRVIDVIDEHTVTITNTKVSVSGAGDSRERVRRYNADYTFDSAGSQSMPSYATQEKVFQIIGGEVMSNIYRGSSACVLAYGQSATGKTYTMFGSEAQPGLVPRLCRAFADQQPLIITVSFLEIYNERVHDLLVETVSSSYHSLPRNRGNARKDLRVREHPSKGTYVQNLRRVTVHNVEALLSLVNEGIRRRRTATTRRNPSSSRSHALLEIVTSHATLHLADLAGSEKAGFEVSGSGRQKEGANINKSLVALSNVISALVTIGRGRTKFIPFRDSALTWLLKDSFSGGSSTFIIATVSPSAGCYGESTSTLRWAERASQLPTKKVTSYEVTATPKSDLQVQFNKLLSELAKNHINYIPQTGKIYYDPKYWHLKKNTKQYEGVNLIANIGNLMNKMHPRTGANNSEPTATPVASGSSDVINTLGNEKISNAVSKEVDKIFGSNLERTSSGSDLKVVAPLRHKRREYRSQEILPVNENGGGQRLSVLPSQSEIQINNIQNADKIKMPHVSILHENQRAEIVAAVTERLYTKLKKKEETAVSRMESIVDKKIVEPLSELKICTNARQRLIELSQRAIRNKRKIGIPAFTQTKRIVIRVKDQGTDVQTDLDSYIVKNSESTVVLYRDVSTETIPMTPRYKEIAVGSKFGSLRVSDKATATEKRKVVQENSCTMTDRMFKNDHFTQTPILPPPRRKKRTNKSTKCCSNENKRKCSEECVLAPVISINISQTYLDDLETENSDENIIKLASKNEKENATPDLLTNHTGDNSDNMLDKACHPKRVDEFEINCDPTFKDSKILPSMEVNEDFSDEEDHSLPRVTLCSTKSKCPDMNNMILGRNENLYPYNIVLSPTREIHHSKRIVKFKETNIKEGIRVASYNCDDFNNADKNNHQDNNNTYISTDDNIEKSSEHENICEETCSDSTESTRHEKKSPAWVNNAGSKTMNYLKKNYIPVYKSNPRFKTAKARISQEFLRPEDDDDDLEDKIYRSRNVFEENVFKTSKNKCLNDDDDINFKKRLHPSKVNTRYDDKYKCEEFGNIERNISVACRDLEKSVKKYDDYIINYRRNEKNNEQPISQRTPTEYLQHLIRIRRELVKSEGGSAEIS